MQQHIQLQQQHSGQIVTQGDPEQRDGSEHPVAYQGQIDSAPNSTSSE